MGTRMILKALRSVKETDKDEYMLYDSTHVKLQPGRACLQK